MTSHEKAMRPEDITRLFVERSNAGDAAGVAALYERDAVMAYPPGSQTVGRAAIRALWEKVLATVPTSNRKNRCQRCQRRHRPHLDPPEGRSRRPGTSRPPPARRIVASPARPARVRPTVDQTLMSQRGVSHSCLDECVSV